VRILIVSNQYAPVIGGIETLLRQLAPRLLARGHEVAVLTGTHRDAREPRGDVDGVTVFRNDIVRAVARRDPVAIARARQAARAVVAELAPQVIHAHDSGPILWAIAEGGVPVLATVHVSTDLYEPAQREPVARQLAKCDWVTAVSPRIAAETAELVPALRGRLSVVANGVPVTPAPPPADPARRRIVAAGRLVALKGFDVLLRAFAEIADADLDTELVIAGDGPLRGELDALAGDLGIGDRACLLGAVRHADMPGVLASASVVAIPSRCEGMPLVALEAGLAARPVVATSIEALAGVVAHGRTGLLVPPDDPHALATALAELLGDPARSARLGRANRADVVANHSLDATVSDYEALYARLTRRTAWSSTAT